ncbi:DUF202 domain-containing protein [Pseudomonas putida]
MPSPIAHTDPGLQPERTLLAWRRTILAMVVCSCFFLRWVPHHHLLAMAPALLCLLTASLAWVRLRRRYNAQVSGLCVEVLAAGVGVHLSLALCVTLLCAVELVTIVIW